MKSNSHCTDAPTIYKTFWVSKKIPSTFVDISAMYVNLSMEIYANVNQENMHFNTNFVEMYLTVNKTGDGQSLMRMSNVKMCILTFC